MKAVLTVLFLLIGLITACHRIPGSHHDPVASHITSNETFSKFTGRTILTFYTDDVGRMTQFYRDVLGFEFLGYWDYNLNCYVQTPPGNLAPIYAGFKAANQKIGLHKATNDYQRRSIGLGMFYFEVRNVIAERHRILASGGKPGEIITTTGLVMFNITDPDGRILRIAANKSDSNHDLF
ncbi:MAG: VOC family protein [Acidobacteria bacterium]|nr:VOC family protein [Acidobacteriota bacterium]